MPIMDSSACSEAGASLTRHGITIDTTAVATDATQVQELATQIRNRSSKHKKPRAHTVAPSSTATATAFGIISKAPDVSRSLNGLCESSGPARKDANANAQAFALSEVVANTHFSQNAVGESEEFPDALPWKFSALDKGYMPTPELDASPAQFGQHSALPKGALPCQPISFRSSTETESIVTPVQTQELESDCITVSRTPLPTGRLAPPQVSVEKSVFAGASSAFMQKPQCVSKMSPAGPPNAAIPRPLHQSKIVTFKLSPRKIADTPRSRQGGASLECAVAATMISTPPDLQASSEEEAFVSSPGSSKKRKQHTEFSPRLYGRPPNPRRAATKGYRGPAIPIDQPQTLETDGRDEASPAAQVTVILSKTRKRPSNDAKASSNGKRQKKNTAPAKPGVRRSSRVATATSGQAVSTVQHEQTSQPPEVLKVFPSPHPQPRLTPGLPRPVRDIEGDRRFVEKLLPILEQRGASTRKDMGKRQNVRISELLKKAKHPGEEEALFLSGEEASYWLQPGKFWTGIIVTTGQQALPLQTVEQFLGEFYEDKAQVWVQDPKVPTGPKAQIVKQIKIGIVKERLLSGQRTDKPWNLLELATHCDDGLRPAFLNSEDSRLLTKLKIPNAADHTRRRVYEQGYKEVEKWALLAEAGALTEPHQDSHGYSTFITINQGLVGFGWLCNPTAEERKQWQTSPSYFEGGNWRYIVLKPGQTVYFPEGTVHFVFRHPHEGHTLAFGGHILRCSNIVHWVKTLIEERDRKEITNEDLTDSASGYLARVEKFVHHAKRTGTEERWGGAEAIEEFLELKKDFVKKRQSRK